MFLHTVCASDRVGLANGPMLPGASGADNPEDAALPNLRGRGF